jgi:hypothetical protein
MRGAYHIVGMREGGKEGGWEMGLCVCATLWCFGKGLVSKIMLNL